MQRYLRSKFKNKYIKRITQ